MNIGIIILVIAAGLLVLFVDKLQGIADAKKEFNNYLIAEIESYINENLV